jgi:hypothetical protein
VLNSIAIVVIARDIAIVVDAVGNAIDGRRRIENRPVGRGLTEFVRSAP